MPHLRTVFTSLLVLIITAGVVLAGEFGTREQVKAMLERAVSVLKADKNRALDLFTRWPWWFQRSRSVRLLWRTRWDGKRTSLFHGCEPENVQGQD